MRTAPLTLALVLLSIPQALWAVDGRVEINQAIVDAAGGFPYTISAPGSYVLTGDLVVPTDVGAIAITTISGVTIDLNGFRVTGPATCSLGSCPLGAAIGVSGPPFFGFGSNIVVHGGTVSGFSGNCILLGSSARVENVHVSQCGDHGIILVSTGGHVVGNDVIATGKHGIEMDGSSIYSHNTVRSAGLGGGGEPGVLGGKATAGNYCDDGSCSIRGERRYYLTTASFLGGDAGDPANCAAGFHFASLWEIYATTNLEYDSNLGEAPVSGSGPPAGRHTWIQTGRQDDGAVGAQVGRANCNGWSSSDGADEGSIVVLGANNSGSGGIGITYWNAPAVAISPWVPGYSTCNNIRQIWCVED